MSIAGVLLAAGASRRYGSENKLLSMLHGQPLVCHAAQALRESEASVLIAVAHAPEVAPHLHGFDRVSPGIPNPEQSDSLRAGVTRALELGATQLVVTLADMPFVTADLINQVIAATTQDSPAAMTDGQRPLPPAGFPAQFFDALLALKGDRGAGQILSKSAQTALIAGSPEMLHDVDTPEAMHCARAIRDPV